MVSFPVSSPVVDPQAIYSAPPPSPPVASNQAASIAYQPDTVTISPAAQQMLKTTQFAYDGSDNQN